MSALAKGGVNSTWKPTGFKGACHFGKILRMPPLRIIRPQDAGDSRGSSFTIPASALQYLGSIADIHVADILPGAVRGNHFHKVRREVVCIRFSDEWSFYWDSGADTPTQTERFAGSGLVLIEIGPGASHAVRNDCRSPLHLVDLSDRHTISTGPTPNPRRVVQLI
jgi:hypothetical protein